MSVEFQILGGAGRDNALWVRIDTGQQISRLLFDCGAGCLDDLGMAETLAIDHLFFSHLHMDHVCGFDAFFRCLFGRDSKRNQIFGPAGTAEILQHRFRGYWWNLIEGQEATWLVTDVSGQRLTDYRFELAESFATRHEQATRQLSNDCDNGVVELGTVVKTGDYSIDAMQLCHHGSSIAYRLTEKGRQNIVMDSVTELGLKPGPWMKEVKAPDGPATIDIDGKTWQRSDLQEKLIVETPGESIAYVTDFLLDQETFDVLAEWLSGCQTLVCEGQYRHEDKELAERYHHTTTDQVSRLAAAAGVRELVLFHLSDRYDRSEWIDMLAQARANFPNTHFPNHWQIP